MRQTKIIVELIMRRRLQFAVFAAAILFTMLREWNAPVACARSILLPARTAQNTR
jgi:type III secretory pathway component EscV